MALYVGDTRYKSIIGSNKASFMVDDSVTLPYDYEVEYLESSGTQYINLGNLGESNKVTFDLEFEVTTKEDNRSLFGSRASTNTRFCWVLAPGANGAVQVGYASSFNNLNLSLTAGDICKVTTSLSESKIHYELLNLTQGTSTSKDYNLAIFSTKDVLLFWNGVLNKAKIRIRGLVVYEDGSVTHEYIPVRIGQVGYMYDKVSGQLFGNAGTGDFVLGPDII